VAPEFQDQLASTLAFALDQAGVANRSVLALKGQLQQEGQDNPDQPRRGVWLHR